MYMKNLMIKGFVLLFSLMSFSALPLTLDGIWTGSLTGPDGNSYPLTYNFKVNQGGVTGTLDSPFGISTIENGKINGDGVTFEVKINGNTVTHQAKLYADSIGLNVYIDHNPWHTTLKRSTKP